MSDAPRREGDGRPLVADGRVLVLSYFYPPMSVGPAFVIDALISRFDPDSVLVFSGVPEKSTTPVDATAGARGAVRRFDVPRRWPAEDWGIGFGARRLRLRLRAMGNVLVALRVAAAGIRAVRRDRIAALLVVYPKQHFLLAGLLAALVTRKPLVVYFMDVYVEGLPNARRVARLLERAVARRAAAVLTMSEPHREHVERTWRRHGVVARPIAELPHPYEQQPLPRVEPPDGRPSIVFSGAIYDAQADAVRRLIEAIRAPVLADLAPHVTLLTQSTPGELRRWGIVPADDVTVRLATRQEARSFQRAADILFLPIAFESRELVRRTAAPSKLPEYLAAAKPILVHAPADSYVAAYATDRGFGEVVAEPDVAALADAIRRLALDSSRREQMKVAAADTLTRHEAAAVAATLQSVLAAAVRRRRRDGRRVAGGERRRRARGP